MATGPGWHRDFDPDRLASIELRAWKPYYRRQPLRRSYRRLRDALEAPAVTG